MRRDVDINDISDGTLYELNDMVKADCGDCKGCSDCCCGMGESIVLDPYDVYKLSNGLHMTFEELLANHIILNVYDGMILPCLKMDEVTDACTFLNSEGRCSIHAIRPGFCRLFPLGRNYEDGKLSYFVLEDACPAPVKSKIKINKWLGVPSLKAYEGFLVEWHALTKGLRAFYETNANNDAVIKAVNMQFLQIFYLTPYTEDDFYNQFSERKGKMYAFLQSLGIIIE